MKKTIILAALLFCCLPLTGKTLSYPEDAVSVDEETYQELKNATCTYDNDSLVCDEIISQFSGKIIIRPNSGLGLYRVNTGDGLPSLTRYMPDGFYKAGKKYYYLVNGTKYQIKKKKSFKRILKLARNNNIATPISNSDFSILNPTCEDNVNPYENEDCQNLYDEAEEFAEKLMNKIIIKVEDNGQMYYVRELANSEGDYYLVALNKYYPKKNKKFFKFIKKQSKQISINIMDEIPVI